MISIPHTQKWWWLGDGSYGIGFSVGKTRNNPPAIAIFIGGIFTIPRDVRGWRNAPSKATDPLIDKVTPGGRFRGEMLEKRDEQRFTYGDGSKPWYRAVNPKIA